MRLWVFSDLHLNFASMKTPYEVPEADVCVVAGDVLVKGPDRSIQWLADNIGRYMPVVFVAGNHEYYHTSLERGLAAGRAAAASNVHFLGGVDKFEPVSCCGEIGHAEEAVGELIVAGGDGAVDLEMPKHALDAVAVPVECPVMLDLHAAV
jgi:Icc-related predicted phosphoesterase